MAGPPDTFILMVDGGKWQVHPGNFRLSSTVIDPSDLSCNQGEPGRNPWHFPSFVFARSRGRWALGSLERGPGGQGDWGLNHSVHLLVLDTVRDRFLSLASWKAVSLPRGRDR